MLLASIASKIGESVLHINCQACTSPDGCCIQMMKTLKVVVAAPKDHL